ncbi:hypothetical protein JPH1_53590 (plasmid) [Mycobacterium avium subsp. hominissuis]|uniref:Uncharacterized protein n=1 Tax=Mycobacterium avium subsp. hominissuis TaxID=439334 RepID=A0AAI8SSZ3_MYCAV|nr:hypothetical protein JPH1_53590 [Mycobacterium avium subsp. hominissuis]
MVGRTRRNARDLRRRHVPSGTSESERASRGDLIHHRSCENRNRAWPTTKVTQPVLTGYLRTLAAAGRGRPPGVTTFDDLTGWLPSLE